MVLKTLRSRPQQSDRLYWSSSAVDGLPWSCAICGLIVSFSTSLPGVTLKSATSRPRSAPAGRYFSP